MRVLAALRVHLTGLFNRARRDRDLDEELRDHLERETAARQAAGASPDEARRAALRDFGGVLLHKEDCRSPLAQLSYDFIADLRYAIRSMAREASFSVITVLTLALGIGATVTIVSAIDAVLLQPLPYPDQQRLVSIGQQNTRDPAKIDDISPANFLDLRERASPVLDAAAAEPYSWTLTTPEGPERMRSWLVSERFFDIFGVRPLLGRTFTPEDFIPGRSGVIVLGHGTWVRRFGGDTGIVGRVVRVDTEPYTIIGVMPPDFLFPPGRDVWGPKIFIDDERDERARTYYRVVARLRDGVTLEAARAQLAIVSDQLRREYPRENADLAAVLTPLQDALAGGAGRVLALFLAAVALLLITACANVGNLFLVRIHRRRQEFAVRSALGAGVGRVRRQVLTESLAVAFLGATLAIVFARWAVAIIRTAAPNALPRVDQMTVSGLTIVVAYALAAATAAAICLLALATSRGIGLAAPTSSGRGASVQRGRLQRSFVALQLAIATMLVVAAGLFIRSLVVLIREDRGFRTDHVVAVTLFAWQEFPTSGQRIQFVHDVIDRLEAVPGIRRAGASSSIPLAERFGPESGTFTLPELPVAAGQEPNAQTTIVAPGYFEALGIPLKQGRTFTWFDGATARPVVIVNDRLARQYWPGRSPIGRPLTVRFFGPPEVREVVGVVADAKRDLPREAPAAVYIPHAQAPTGSISFVVHTSQEPDAVLPSIKTAIRSIGPATALGSVTTLDTLLEQTVSPRRFTLMMVAFFAAAALLVGAIGTYGVIAYATAERTKEIGIRVALGGRPRHVIAGIVGDGMRIAAVGVATGLLIAAAAGRLVRDMLYGVAPVDALTYAAAAAALAAIALVASGVPAWRAARLDPSKVLRAD
jgi:putative ABC transport system permease protein